jgi:hypothetical protein
MRSRAFWDVALWGAPPWTYSAGLAMEPSEQDDTGRQDERALEEAGLYDPTSPTAADRLAALRYMIDHGTSIAYLKAGNDRGRLFAGQTMSVLWGDIEWFTLGEVADRAGLDEDTLRRLRRSCGLPDPGGERACPAVEVELWQAAAAAIALVGDEPLSGFLWSLGAAASASAEATLALARAANPLSWQSEAPYAEWALRAPNSSNRSRAPWICCSAACPARGGPDSPLRRSSRGVHRVHGWVRRRAECH